MKNQPSRKSSAVLPLPEKEKGKAGRIARRASKPASTQGERAAGAENIRIMPAKREPLPTRTDFDHGYIPLDGKQRRARRGLLRQWAMTPDPLIAERLRWQENVEIPFREVIVSIYGKGSGWREAVLVEAKHDPHAREELGLWLGSVASNGDQEEFSAFAKAISKLALVNEAGAINRKRLVAILFILRCWTEKRGLPTQAKVREVLKSAGFETEGYTRNNEARTFFTGPILGTLPKAKAGRKKLPSFRPKR